MSSSNQKVGASHIPQHPSSQSKSLNKKGYCLIALSVITLVGTLVAAGLLYSKLGYTSLALPTAGFTLTLLTFFSAKSCCVQTKKEIILGKKKTPLSNPHPRNPVRNNTHKKPSRAGEKSQETLPTSDVT